MKRTLALVLLVLVAACSNDAPPQQAPGRGEGMAERERPRMRAGTSSLALLPPPAWWHDEALAKAVNLTPDQLSQLDKISATQGGEAGRRGHHIRRSPLARAPRLVTRPAGGLACRGADGARPATMANVAGSAPAAEPPSQPRQRAGWPRPRYGRWAATVSGIVRAIRLSLPIQSDLTPVSRSRLRERPPSGAHRASPALGPPHRARIGRTHFWKTRRVFRQHRVTRSHLLHDGA